MSNATLQCVSFSGVAAHGVLPTNKSGNTDQSKTRSLECARDSSLQHSAQSTCSKRSTQDEGKSAVWCGRHPAFRATGAAYVRLPDLQAVRKQQLAVKAELAQLQAPRSLPEHQDLYKHSLGERLSSTAGVWRPPRCSLFTTRPIAKIGPSPAQLPSCRNKPVKPS